MPAVHETAYPHLKRQPSALDLAQIYTPTQAEHALAARQTKGPVARIGFLVMLKTFQRLGYFVRLSDVPEAIVQHVIACTTLPLTFAQLQDYDASGTRQRHLTAIRAYRHVQPYDPTVQRRLIRSLVEAARTKTDLADLINVGIEELIRLRCELPAFAPLCRLARHARAVVHQAIYRQVQERLTPAVCAQLDQLLVADPVTKHTPWNNLKRDPGTPTLTHLKDILDHVAWLATLGNIAAALALLPDVKRKHFAAEANTLDAARMAALEPAKRATLLAALVVVRTAQARDDMAEMFIKRMLGIHQKAKEALAAYHAKHQGRTDDLIATLRDVVRAYQHTGTGDERITAVGGALTETPEAILAACEAHLAYAGNNYFPFLWPCYRSHRPTLFRLARTCTLESTSQDTSFLDSVAFLLRHENSKADWLLLYREEPTATGIQRVPILDLSWVPEGWWRLLTDQYTTTPQPKQINRRHFEVCIFTQLLSELKSGDVAVVGSDAYADYRTQLIDWEEYHRTVQDYGAMVGLPTEGAAFVAHVRQRLSDQAQKTDTAFPTNDALRIEQGEPVLSRLPRRPEPPGLAVLETAFAQRLAAVNILDVIRYTAYWLEWTAPFGPISGHAGKLESPTARYLATVFCYGCNLGPTQTARGIVGLDRKQIAWPNQRHITEDALEEAITITVNAYQRMALPQQWGSGKHVSADGTKWDIYEQNLLAEYHIRYGGYGGIGYYHVSDTYIALFSHFIPCGVWEAVYILDGLLNNDSEIQPDTVHADTQGQNAPVFALAFLLGITLMPRIRNWKRLTFFRPQQSAQYTHIDDLFSNTIDWKLIETHLPDMLRVVLSIKAGRITPSAILRRLSSYNRHNRLYQAFRELGRAIRTEFLLQYLADPAVRAMIQAATNKSESFNRLVQWIAFGGDQVIGTNDRAAQRKIIKYNHLVANCMIFYNVVVMSQVLQELQAEGVIIELEALAALSPYITEHIDRFGRYSLDVDQQPPALDASVFSSTWLPRKADAQVTVGKPSQQGQEPAAGTVQLGLDGW